MTSSIRMFTVADNAYSGGTGLSARVAIFPSPPPQEHYTLQYTLLGPFIEPITDQTLPGFPSEAEALAHGVQLFSVQCRAITSCPLFEPLNRRRNSNAVLHWQLGDSEADATMDWSGDDGWQWTITYKWAELDGDTINESHKLDRFDAVAAYVELRRKFLEIVRLLGGSALDIVTLATPFNDGEPLPLTMPVPYAELQDPLLDRDALRQQIEDEMRAFAEAHPDGLPQEEEEEQIRVELYDPDGRRTVGSVPGFPERDDDHQS